MPAEKRYVLLASAAVLLLFCGPVSVDADKLSDNDPNAKALYESVRDLLLFKIDNWLKNDGYNLAIINEYLGFPIATINLLNISMTELMHLEHATENPIEIPDLIELFFYSCDLWSMRKYSHNDRPDVTANFNRFLEKFEYVDHQWKGLDVIDFQNKLLEKVRDVTPKSKPNMTVSVAMMKNRLLTDPRTNNETVLKLRPRFIKDYHPQLEKQTEGKAIIATHVSILMKIAPDVFGFVYDHVTLLCALLEHADADAESIQNVKLIAISYAELTVMFKDVMVNRCIALKPDAISEDRKDKLESVLTNLTELGNLLNPDKNWIGDEKPPKIQDYTQILKTTVDKTLREILELLSTESVDDWKNNRTIRNEATGQMNFIGLLRIFTDNGAQAYEFARNVYYNHVTRPIPSRTAVANLVYSSVYNET